MYIRYFARLNLLFFLVFASSALSVAQVNADSLRQIWSDVNLGDSIRFQAINDYAKANAYSNPQSILAISDFHYDLAQSKNNTIQMVYANENKAYALGTLGQFDRALSYSQKAIDLAPAIKDSIILAKRYTNRGNIFYQQSKFKEAIQYYLTSKSILETQDADLALADLLNNIGLIHFSIGSYDFALDYLQKALTLYKKLGIEDAIGEVWTNMGVAHYENDSLEKAVENIQKALPILKAQDHIVGMEYCYYYLAGYHQQNNQMDSAFHYINKSIEINEKIDNPSNMVRSKISLGNLLIDEDIPKAIQLAQEALTLSPEVLNQSAKRDIYQLLYKCYKKQGKIDLALAMHEEYVIYNDSSIIQENQLVVVREELKSDYEQKLLETKYQNEEAKTKLQLRHLRRVFAIILGSLLLIGVISFVARQRILAQKQEQEKLLSEIERLKRKRKPKGVTLYPSKFQLDRSKIEQSTQRKLNETDWNVLNILLDDPVISNKGIAEKAFMTVDGIGSSLRRMYSSFDIKESKYKKISLLMEAIKISNN